MKENYIEINRKTWNEKTEFHIQSDFYNQEGFLNGENSLTPIELELLGNIKDKSILHLQCHFGQDTISFSRLGAKSVGVDLSDNAIGKAKEIAQKLNTDTRFICCDIYDLPNHLNEQFDIVFTSYGTIGWLPDLDKWAKIIAQFLKPGGKFIMADFHPVVWMFDDNFEKIGYNYFKSKPIIETVEGTYADKNAPINSKTITWNQTQYNKKTPIVNSQLEFFALK